MKTHGQIKDEPIDIDNYSNKIVNELHNQEQESSLCAWCQKLGNKLFSIDGDHGEKKHLCSEICFNQYRRASFKKNQDSRLTKPYSTILAKKSKLTRMNPIENNHDRRKILSTKTNGLSRNASPSSVSKRHCSSSINPSFFLPPPSIDIQRFQFPFLTSSSQLTRPIPMLTSEPSPSTLYQSLSKSFSSNSTCILPTFIPLPIPIPIIFPINSSSIKYTTKLINQECQTEVSNKRKRRISI